MPPCSDDEDDGPAGQRTPFEEEQQHELNQLIDYEGDSDDESPDAEAIECNVDNAQYDTEGERAVETRHEGYTACDDTLTQEDLAHQQGQRNAPLLIPGAPPGWSSPVAPKDWKPPKIASSLGQPDVAFSDIDNPGGWSEYMFAPKFQYNKMKREKYLYHAMPAGATPVPKNPLTGKRTSEGFEFFYNGWTRERTDPVFRSGATRNDLFPQCRKSTLDADLLSKLGMNKDRMYHTNDAGPDSLFFYQLILPIHDTRNNGTVDGDPRKPFYPHVSECTEIYSIADLKLRGSGRGHHWMETSPIELTKWDGILIFDGVLGGSNGAMLRRWDKSRPDNSSFNKAIYETMSSTRWLELKHAMKLNNNMTATRPGDPNHNPTQKYNYIWDVLCHNTNVLTKDACLDLCGDETSWMFAGWAEKESVIIKRELEKPRGSKGGRTVIVTDVDRVRIRACKHRIKRKNKHFRQEGCNEVMLIIDKLMEQIRDSNQQPHEFVTYDDDYSRPRHVFRELPHITWDNFFSGDDSMNYAAKKGFGMTCTVNKGRLPGKVPQKHWHTSKTKTDHRSRCARYESPIVAVKRDPRKWGNDSMWLHCSFQSTGPCNISHINAINSCSLYAHQKERGRALFKRTWAIEMSESRQLYLATCDKVDRIDHMVKNCNINYQ